MTGEEFYRKRMNETNWPKNDLCDPPTDPRTAIHILIDHYSRETILWKSKKGNWLVTYKKCSNGTVYAEPLTSTQAMSLLVKYDIETYEKIFGEIGEA